MSKQKKAKQVTSPRLELVELARFLNGNVRYLKQRDQVRENQIRGEIINDISPLLQPAPGTNSEALLKKLVMKINQMGLRPKWVVGSSKPFVVEFGGKVVTMSGPELGPGRGVFKIGSQKYVVRHSFGESYDTQSVKNDYAGVKRKVLYSEIITSLENGEFARLVRCPECTRFFVSARVGQKYCKIECTNAADTKAAAARMEEHRKGVEKKIRAAGLPKLARLEERIKMSKSRSAEDLIDEIPELSKLRSHLGEIWADFMPVVEEMKRGSKGTRAIWNSLRRRLKNALADAPI